MTDHSDLTRNAQNTGLRTSVDVIIPVYNGERFILQALSSVAKQTHLPNRIIVVDDGSTDKTPELVHGFNCDVPVDYVRKSNGGLSSARNTGIRLSTSEFIAFLDADDEWYPNKLEEQLKVMRNTDLHNVGVVYCKYAIIDGNGDLTDKYPVFELDTSLRGSVFSKLLMANKVAGSGSGVLIRRECFAAAGLFDESLTACEDWDMWLRMAERYEFDFAYEALVKIRRHDTNMQRNALHMFTNQLRLYEKWISRLSAGSDCFVIWRKDIVHRFVADLPGINVVKLVKQLISEDNRRKLFKNTYGSIWLYILGVIPMIAVRSVVRRARRAWVS